MRPALEAFSEEQKAQHLGMLVNAVRQSVRDTMKEARLAGKVEVYESLLAELQEFARRQLKQAGE